MLNIRFIEVHKCDEEGNQRVEVQSYEINYTQATPTYKRQLICLDPVSP